MAPLVKTPGNPDANQIVVHDDKVSSRRSKVRLADENGVEMPEGI